MFINLWETFCINMGGITAKMIKFMNLYLMVCPRETFCNETILVQKVVCIQSNFAFLFLNNALPHQLVTIKG